jgi:toxin-antitoxin system PIN domain toxin
MVSVILIDVNILVYAHRPDAEGHTKYENWLEETLNSGETCGLSELALCGMVRIVTHPRIYHDPTPIKLAVELANRLRDHEACMVVSPGRRHWEIFTELCKAAAAKGNLVTDAYFAALAIESGSEWITADRDFARFPDLKWRHPFA